MASLKTAELKITGMTCANCVRTIEKSLSTLNGVSRAQINLGTETGIVEYDPRKLKLADMENAVIDAGYGVVNENTVIKIGGMTCANCVIAIEKAIKKLEGIANVNVNLSAEKAYVTYNSKITTISNMRLAIENAGYQYLGVEGEETEDLEKASRDKNLREKRNRIIIGFAVSILLMAIMYFPLNLPFPMAYLMLVVSTPVFLYVLSLLLLAYVL